MWIDERSAMAAGGGIGLVARGDVEPARRVAVAGAILELAATAVLEHRIGFARTAYTDGRPGRLLRAARAATAAVVPQRERLAARRAVQQRSEVHSVVQPHNES